MKYRIIVDMAKYNRRVTSDWMEKDYERLVDLLKENTKDIRNLKVPVEGNDVFISGRILQESIIILEKRDES